jgi:arylsulfatase A-like enzyme
MKSPLAILAAFLLVPLHAAGELAKKPNILWLIAEDMSPHFGCYGEKTIQTPNVDKLAADGVLFENAFVTSPICSPSRSALITGMYQTSIGAHHHRSGVGMKIELPADVQLVPRLFQQAGYHTSNGGHPAMNRGKTDYNFTFDPAVYDGTDWKTRKTDQPFFAQIQLMGGKIRDLPKELAAARKQLGSATPTGNLTLPPYYPGTPALLDDWAATLDAVRITDHQAGDIIERLRHEGILDETIIFFITDHGVSHGRGKQFLYDEGTHIAFVASGPGLPKGQRRKDLIEHIDMAAMSLALAGIPLPETMQARNSLAPDYQPREATYSARDRADETVDHIRSVRTERFKYIRNFLPQRPYLQPNDYKDTKPSLIALRAAEAAGQLNDVQRLLFAKTRPPEELYELAADPWEVRNLAADPVHAQTLLELRENLDRWMERTNDQGRTPESEARYDAEMAVYLKRRNPVVEQNIKLMKQWATDGK